MAMVSTTPWGGSVTVTDPVWTVTTTKPKRAPDCTCPSCGVTKGLAAAEAALKATSDAYENLIERDTNTEGNLYFLLDEVEKALTAHPRLRRYRLAKALRTVRRCG